MNNYQVKRIDCKTAKDYIRKNHYSHGCHNGPSPCYGLFDNDNLIGCLMFATPCSENVRASVFGKEYKNSVIELHRLHILDVTPKNTESWFIARCLKKLKEDKPQIKAVISFSDSTEGHDGTIYKATNAYRIGRTGNATFYIDETGRLRHPRQCGVNISKEQAKLMGWKPCKRACKNRYLYLLPNSKAEKRKLIKMCKYDLSKQDACQIVGIVGGERMSDIQLYNGDCIELMKNIPDGSVDLTVTSPPYDNLRTYNGNIDQWNFEKFKAIAKELYRVTADGGVVVWIVADATIKGSETGTSFRQALWFMECGFNLHDTMIYRTSKPPMNGRRYQQCFEYMFVFSKGRPNTFNALMEQCKNAGKKVSATYYNADGTKKERHGKSPVKETKPLENIWYIVQRPNNGHPAVFPEQLAKDHIISWSNEGDTVLDPFMGSGTTGKMAVLNNRHFIGIELDESYFNIAKQRIEKAEQDA